VLHATDDDLSGQLSVCRESTHYTIADSHHDVTHDAGHLRLSRKSYLSVRELSLTRSNGLWYNTCLVPAGTESLAAKVTGTLRALGAHMLTGMLYPTFLAPHLLCIPRPCPSSGINFWATPV
jgi:hypothetical protein